MSYAVHTIFLLIYLVYSLKHAQNY